MLRSLRNWFISGLLLLSPIAVTVFVLNLLVQRLGAPTRRVLFGQIRLDPESQFWLESALNVIALIAILTLITLFGRISQLFIGRYVISTFERLVNNLPFVRTVYNTVKQIRDTFVQQEKAVFQQTVLVEYPKKGTYALGFLTGTARGETQERTSADLINIFVPTTPNPTSGFLLMVPREEVIFLQMSIGDGMKLIISGGAVVPSYPAKPLPIPPSPPAEPPAANK